MGRHSAPDDNSDTGESAAPVDLTDTGRHYFPDFDLLTVPPEQLETARSDHDRLTETGRHYFPDHDDDLRSDAAHDGSDSGPGSDDNPGSPARSAGGSVGLLTRPAAAAGAPAVQAKADTSVGAPGLTPPSRAGRNLPAAIGVGLVLAAAVVASLLIYRASFVVIVTLAMAYGSFEVVRAMSTAGIRPPLVPLLVGGAAIDVVAWYQGANGLVLGLLLTVLGIVVWRLDEGFSGYQRDAAAGAFIAVYVPALGAFAILLVHYSDGAGRVIAFIATVACSDIGGYATGVLLGRHPMAPTVSPKKSWEGFAGSLIACAAAGALLMSLLFHHSWVIGLLFGLAIAVTATLGDLGESMIKRDLGVKDMGRLLPGHGGLMDRLDSLLPCAAVSYLIMAAALR